MEDAFILKRLDYTESKYRADFEDSTADLWGIKETANKIVTKAREADEGSQAYMHALLGACAGMMLSPDTPKEVFKPLISSATYRSMAQEDITQNHVNFFADILDDISSSSLKARLADLAWTCAHKRNVQHAKMAIELYLKMPISPEYWFDPVSGGELTAMRALYLSSIIKGDDVMTMRTEMLERLKCSIASFQGDEYAFIVSVTTILLKHCSDKIVLSEIVKNLETIAEKASKDASDLLLGNVFDIATKYHGHLGNEAKKIEALNRLATIYEDRIANEIKLEAPNYAKVAFRLGKIVEVLTPIPNKYRKQFHITQRLKDSKSQFAKYNGLSFGEPKTLSSAVDISPLIQEIDKKFEEVEPVEALFKLCCILPWFSLDAAIATTKEVVREHPLSSMFVTQHFDKHNNTIKVEPPLNSNSPLDESNESFMNQVRGHYMLELQLHRALIRHARELVFSKFAFGLQDFLYIVKRSGMVPTDNEHFFARALHAGYCGDFAEFLHFMMPSFENYVRHHLNLHGAITQTHDEDGSATEVGLNTLVARPEIEKVFDKSMVFEIHALFCDRAGGNLRNKLAHGLIDQSDCNSPACVYAWWLILKMTIACCSPKKREEK